MMSVNFKSNWVKELVDSSNNLTQHCYISNLVKSTNYLRTEIESMFNCFTYDDPPMLRSYVDGGQRYGFTEKFIALAQSAEFDSLEARIAHALEVDKFCITLNGLTKWSEHFTSIMQDVFVQEIFSRTGFPYGGCDFYSFIGNYGFTPFGVHDDDDHSLLIHLGPGNKTVYVWSREQYKTQTGHFLTTIDFQYLLSSGQKYDLGPGDFVFIPKGDFHVFETREYSVTMGFTVFPLNTSDDLNQVIAGMMSKERKDVFFCTNEDYFIRSSAETSPISLRDLVSSRRVALQSNGFVTTLPRQRVKIDKFEYKQQDENTRYFVAKYLPICLYDLGKQATLFVRGRVVKLSIEKGLEHFVTFLNEAKTFTRSELIEIMSDYWLEDVTCAMFDCFYSLGGIYEVLTK